MKKILLLLLLPIITFAQKEVVVHIKTDNYPSKKNTKNKINVYGYNYSSEESQNSEKDLQCDKDIIFTHEINKDKVSQLKQQVNFDEEIAKNIQEQCKKNRVVYMN